MGNLQSLDLQDFAIDAREEGGAILLKCRGSMKTRDPDTRLVAYLNACLDSAGPNLTVVDLSDVTFMNSSAMLPVIALLRKAGTEKRSLEVRFKEAVGWQRITFQSLKVVCDKLKTVRLTLV